MNRSMSITRLVLLAPLTWSEDPENQSLACAARVLLGIKSRLLTARRRTTKAVFKRSENQKFEVFVHVSETGFSWLQAR